MKVFQTKEELTAWYEEAARAYLKRLSPEQIMEATEQATQREITLESLALVKPSRPDLYVFNELLVQYPHPEGIGRKPRQVVPDNTLVLSDVPIQASGSFNLSEQPAGPFCVLEYVSKNSERKDYDDNMLKYEKELKVPYYLLFYPDNQELTLYRHTGQRYVTVLPNQQEHYPIPELDLEVALLGGWVRFWFRGVLLPLPAELQRALHESRQEAERQRQEAERQRQRADSEAQARLAAEQEVARLRALLETRDNKPGG